MEIIECLHWRKVFLDHSMCGLGWHPNKLLWSKTHVVIHMIFPIILYCYSLSKQVAWVLQARQVHNTTAIHYSRLHFVIAHIGLQAHLSMRLSSFKPRSHKYVSKHLSKGIILVILLMELTALLYSNNKEQIEVVLLELT